jgi:flagella basal body P-ring formation protein FlgA
LAFSFVLALVLTLLARRAAGGEPAFQLRPQAQVGAAGIFLSNVLFCPLHPIPSTLRLAPAPSLGQTTSLSRRQVIALAKEADPELDTTNWTGPDQVTVTRRTRSLGEGDVAELLREALQGEYVSSGGTLEIHLTKPWPAIPAPVEDLKVRIIEIPPAGILANMVVGFELWCGQEQLGAWQEPLQARVWRDVPVAHGALTRGQLLREADIGLERRDALTLHEPCIAFPVMDPTLELAANVQAGMPVCARHVHRRAVVHRGQLVEALFQDGTLSISLRVQALEDGTLGQMVRVINPKTRRELSGKIQNEDLVLITL